MALFTGVFLLWLVVYGNRHHRRLRAMHEALTADGAGRARSGPAAGERR